MDPILEPFTNTPRKKKLFNDVPVACVPSLKAFAIMEDEPWIIVGSVRSFYVGFPSTVMGNVNILVFSVIANTDTMPSRTFKLMLKIQLMRDDFPTPPWAVVNPKS